MSVVARTVCALAPLRTSSFNKSVTTDNVVIADILPMTVSSMPNFYFFGTYINTRFRRTAMDDDFFYCSHLYMMFPNDLTYNQFQ